MKHILAPIALVALGACSTQALVASAFPDREMFSFATADQTSVFTYACGPGEDAQSRAQAAHRLTDQTMTRFADSAADTMLDGFETGRTATALAFEMNRNADAMAEQLQDDIETRYTCLLVDTADI